MSLPNQLTLNLTYKPSFKEADFVSMPSNEEAYHLIRQWPDWPIRTVAICGENGCGKTHLAHIWQAKSQATLLSPSHPALSNPPHQAVEQNSAFILDDADLMENQEWLFHFYNLIQEKKGYLLFCAKAAPTHWKITLPDLASRLSTVMTVTISEPDDAALKQIIFKQLSDRGIIMGSDLIDYTLNRIERSFKGAQSIVNIIDRYSLAFKRSPSPAMIREILQRNELQG